MKPKTLIPLWIAAGLFALLTVIGAATQVLGVSFFYNTSASAPVGFYMSFKAKELKAGEWVVVNFPQSLKDFASKREWLRDAPLIKRIAGVRGDGYCSNGKQFLLNGLAVGPIFKEDNEGRALPQLEGCITVGEDELLVIGIRNERSFDSRYFGAVKKRNVIGRVWSLLVW